MAAKNCHDKRKIRIKAESARIFKVKWDECRENEDYLRMKKEHRERYKDVE
ncbi:DUF4385 family protein [Psychrobacter sp. ER1]|uniref:DUF4385 family protein n=1 Tax=Psychrobacter sp. ER1 TaxID=3406645 RepID=UPI003B4377DE